MNKTMYKGFNTPIQPSPAIWANCPILEMALDPTVGFGIYEDFANFANAASATAVAHLSKGWTGYTDAGGTIVDAAIIGGGKTFASDGDDEGAAICASSQPFIITRYGGEFWFEACLQVSAIDNTKNGIFVGLMDSQTLSATVPIAAAGTLADANIVGFHRLEADGDKLDTVYKADGVTQVTVKADAITLVAATDVKVGMRFTPDDGYLRFYKDGVELADKKLIPNSTGLDFPDDISMGPVFALLNATGSTPGSATLKWIRAYQRYV